MRACGKPESRQGAFEQFHNKSKRSNKHEGRINSPLAPWKFPEINLEEALKVAKAIDEKFAGNPTKADALVICGGIMFFIMCSRVRHAGETRGFLDPHVIWFLISSIHEVFLLIYLSYFFLVLLQMFYPRLYILGPKFY